MQEIKRVVNYKDFEIYKLGKELAIKVHRITLNALPKFEMYEEGSQIRRSSKSIVSNLIEGFGRRRYKNEFIKFLTYAIASCDETKVHLEMLYETNSLSKKAFNDLYYAYNKKLGAKLYNFRQSVIEKHNIFKES